MDLEAPKIDLEVFVLNQFVWCMKQEMIIYSLFLQTGK